MAKRCSLCERTKVKFGEGSLVCYQCHGILTKFTDDGLSREDAKLKVRCGLHREGKIAFWTIMLKRSVDAK